MELDCPLCHAPLDVKGSSAHCAQCERVFTLEAPLPGMPPAAGGAEGVRRGGLLLPAWAWPDLEKTGGIYSAGLVGEGFLARVFFTVAICFTSLSTQPSFRRVVSQIAGFDLFCLLQHRTVAHRGDAVAPRQGG